MAAESDYAAFISYAHVDDRWARWLHRRLETYRLPRGTAPDGRRKLGKVFLDRSELATSGSLSSAIQTALDRSGALVVICSPTSAASRWVNEEVRRFRAQGRGDRIFCLLVDGGSDNNVPFPPALLEALPGDEPVEPLAADARPGKDGRADAALKLIAGIERVPFDALRRREQGRRQRRLAAVAAVSVVLLAIMTVLAAGQLLARREAERQRDTAQRTTGFLMRIFLEAAPEYAAGRDVTVREMMEVSATKTLEAPELSREPAVKATLLTSLAEVLSRMGEYDRSAKLLGVAKRIDRDDATRRLWQASVDAENALQTGNLAGARSIVDRALAGSGESRADDQDDRLRLMTLSGQVARANGEYDEARRRFAEARRTALSLDPPNRFAAARAALDAGLAALDSGDEKTATADLRTSIAERVALGQPNHLDLLSASNSLAVLAAKRGDTRTAEHEFRRVLALQTHILGAGHSDTATTRGNLGRALVEQRRFIEAERELGAARASLEAKAGAGALALANIDDSLGLAQTGLARHAAARASFARGLTVARANRMPKEVELLADRGALECTVGDVTAGRALVADARAALARFRLPEPWRAARLDQVDAGCLIDAGRPGEAAPLVRRSADAVIARWKPGSLFGVEAERQRRAVVAIP